MSETEKLIAEVATRLLAAHVGRSGLAGDLAYARRALADAKLIVIGAQDGKGGRE